MLAVLGLPLVELEAARDRDAAALLEVLTAALGEPTKTDDIDVDRAAILAFAPALLVAELVERPLPGPRGERLNDLSAGLPALTIDDPGCDERPAPRARSIVTDA